MAFEVNSVPSPLSLGPMALQWQLADDDPRLAMERDEGGQLPRHPPTRDRGVDHAGQTPPGDIIEHVQDPEPAPVNELVLHKGTSKNCPDRAAGVESRGCSAGGA